MPGNIVGIWCGSQVPPPPPQVLEATPDGGAVGGGGGVLWRTIPQRDRRDAGGPTVSHNIQCGGGRNGPPLEIIGGVKIGRG